MRILALAVMLVAAGNAVAAADDLLASLERAHTVLQRAIAAHGGSGRLPLAQTFDLSASLENQSVHQSPRPEPPFLTWTVDARYVADPARDRYFFETDARFPSFRNFNRTVVTRGEGWLLDHLAKTKVVEPNLAGALGLMSGRLLPTNLLLEASRRAATLRWAGESVEAGTRQLAISYVRPNGELYTLYFAADTNLLARLETLQANTLDGDVTFVHAYGDYREVGGVVLPFTYQIRRGPWTVTQAKVRSLRIGQPSNDQDFVLPPYRELASFDPPMRLETIVPGVHVVRAVPGGYNVLCVEFSDHLLVVETPEENSRAGLSEQIIAFIEQSLPGKPIRYAVPTHHHSDHAGGIRAYIAKGAVIVSSRANEAHFRSIVGRRSSIAPDALDRARAVPRFEVFRGPKLVLKDGAQEVEIHAIGPAPHVDEALIAYLPKHKLLFQTDLSNPWACWKDKVGNEDIGHTTALGDTQALIAAVERLGLEVERVIGGHGQDVSYSWLKAHTARRAADGLPMWACTAEELQ